MQFPIIGMTEGIPEIPQEKSADVAVPVGNSRQRNIQARRNLSVQSLPGGHHVARPEIRSVALLACKSRAGQYEHTLVGRFSPLLFGHTTHRHQRKSITDFAKRAKIGLLVKIRRLEIKMIRLGGIDPKAVHAQRKQALIQVAPIKLPGLGIIGIVNLYSRRVFLIDWRSFRAVGRPGGYIKKGIHFFEFFVLFGLRAKGIPDGYNNMGIELMYFVNHSLRIMEVRVQKIHGIPQIIIAPVLPILNNTVQGHSEFPVFTHHRQQFLLAFVAFTALPKTVSPQREHRDLSREFTHTGNYSVGTSAVHKIIIDALSYLRIEIAAGGIVFEHRGRIIVPKQTIGFD